MQRESDLAYFTQRAREERDRAENVADPAGYRLHTDFAREYERRVEALVAKAAASAGAGEGIDRKILDAEVATDS